jgi:homoserine kinase
MLTAKVFAPGTVANVGPGFDCLGLCLEELGDLVTVGPAADGQDLVVVTGRDANEVPRNFAANAASIAAHAVRRDAGLNVALSVHLERSLPLSGGLGASAASAVGGAMATAYALGLRPNWKQVLEWALEAEERVAGRHLDNIAPCLVGGLTVSSLVGQSPGGSGEPWVHTLPLSQKLASLWLVLVTPRLRIQTREARALLPDEVSRGTYVTGVFRVAAVMAGLLRGDPESLRLGLEDPFAVPARRQLIPGFDRAYETALAAGALGLSISGSGPTLFAPCMGLDVASDVAERIVEVFQDVGASAHVCRVSGTAAPRWDQPIPEPPMLDSESHAPNGLPDLVGSHRHSVGGAHCVFVHGGQR